MDEYIVLYARGIVRTDMLDAVRVYEYAAAG